MRKSRSFLVTWNQSVASVFYLFCHFKRHESTVDRKLVLIRVFAYLPDIYDAPTYSALWGMKSESNLPSKDRSPLGQSTFVCHLKNVSSYKTDKDFRDPNALSTRLYEIRTNRVGLTARIT